MGRGVRRAYRFRLRPTAGQHVRLAACLDAHRELYNAALQERRVAYDRVVRASPAYFGERPTMPVRYATQSGQLSEIRAGRPDVGVWSFSSQQATVRRLDKAFAAFFGRVKAGETPGYPRFKAAHRKVEGAVKTVSVKREGRKWYLVLSCDGVPACPLEPTGAVLGVDVGIADFLTTSEGRHEPNPRWSRTASDRLEEAQHVLARKKRGSNNRRSARETVAARHRKVANLGGESLTWTPGTPPTAASVAQTRPKRTVSARRCSSVGPAGTPPRPTSTLPEMFSGLDWPFSQPNKLKPREKKLAASAVREVTNLTRPDPECDLDYVANEARALPVRTAIANAFGVGGQNCVAVFSARS